MTFPSEVRSTGVVVCAASARLVAMMVQYVNGALVDRPDILITISGFAMLMGSLFSFALRETSMKPLTDTILLTKDIQNQMRRNEGGIEMKHGSKTLLV